MSVFAFHTPPTNPHLAKPLTVGPLSLTSNLFLAPVANYCDLAFRIIARQASGPALALACTDLLSPQGLLRGTAQSLDLARTHDLDRPVGMQLYGGDPDILAQGAEWAVRHGANLIDINMGCPVDKVTKKDGGSKLLCNPVNTVTIARSLVETVARASRETVPVTAKLRLGWGCDDLVAPELAHQLERAGIALITVHGRTAAQKFKGDVNHEGIKQVVDAVDSIPVLGNGDVTDPASALRMFEATGCQGIMVGRGAFARPWLFAQLWAAQRGERIEEPTLDAKLQLIRTYLDRMLEFRGERYAMAHITRRITWFAKAIPPCKPLKETIRNAKTPANVHKALDEFAAGGLRSPERHSGPRPAEPVAAA